MAWQREKLKVQQMVGERALGMGYRMGHQRVFQMVAKKGNAMG